LATGTCGCGAGTCGGGACVAGVAPQALWRTTKSHFQPLVKMGIKTVDKNIDKKKQMIWGGKHILMQ